MSASIKETASRFKHAGSQMCNKIIDYVKENPVKTILGASAVIGAATSPVIGAATAAYLGRRMEGRCATYEGDSACGKIAFVGTLLSMAMVVATAEAYLGAVLQKVPEKVEQQTLASGADEKAIIKRYNLITGWGKNAESVGYAKTLCRNKENTVAFVTSSGSLLSGNNEGNQSVWVRPTDRALWLKAPTTAEYVKMACAPK